MRLTEVQLAEIRERDARVLELQARIADDDRHALLLHIAATQPDAAAKSGSSNNGEVQP
jgi:hypothetical protein